MNVLVYLVPMALLLGLTGLAAFMWSLSSGQYDDVEGAGLRILDNDDIETSSEFRAKRSFVRNLESLERDSGS
jgi:cbb3-type cytochrome oxidase maturation protein